MTVNDIAGKTLVSKHGFQTVHHVDCVCHNWQTASKWFLKVRTNQSAISYYIEMAPHSVYVAMERTA